MPDEKKALKCQIIQNSKAKHEVFRLVVESQELADTAAPGQFAMIKCGGGAYLRRPLSFCDTSRERGTVTFMYRLAAAGTRALALKAAGGILDIIGPLGTGFTLAAGGARAKAANGKSAVASSGDTLAAGGAGAKAANGKSAVASSGDTLAAGGAAVKAANGKLAIVGGGIGVFPLLLLSRRIAETGRKADIYVGFNDKDSVMLEPELKSFASKFVLVSNDGSAGRKGLVTDAFKIALANGTRYGAVYACGPVPMFAALQKICQANGVSAQFSLEQRMACGIGACLVCAQAVKSGAGDSDAAGSGSDACACARSSGTACGDVAAAVAAASGTGYRYARVCRDGPVFAADELLFGAR